MQQKTFFHGSVFWLTFSQILLLFLEHKNDGTLTTFE